MMRRGPEPAASTAAPGTRHSWSKEVSDALLSVRWLGLAVVGLAAFALGYFGFQQYYDDVGTAKSTSDLLYLSLQLFTLESGSVPQAGVPWQLEVARLAAPLASATALVATLAAAFHQQIQDWRLRRERDHVVVCGLGTRGARLATELLEAGYGVVGIEADGQNQTLVGVRRRGAAVIVGDARDPDTLRRARLGRASHLVCLTSTDDTNAEVALQAASLVTARQGPALNCLAHIRDPDLCVLMRSEELASTHRGGSRLDFFNVDEQGARIMLRDPSPFPPGGSTEAAPSVLVLGSNRLGQYLVAELARQWRGHPAAHERPIHIAVVDPNAAEVLDRLRRRYPLLDEAAQLLPVVAELDPLDTGALTPCAASIAYVCMDEDSGTVQAALRVQHLLTDPDANVVVGLVHATGMVRALDRPDHSGRIRAINVLDETMRPGLLLGGTYELLARAIHDEYLENQRHCDTTTDMNASMVPWQQLPSSLKESNRDQAAHIGTKLAAIGWGIAPLTNWDADKQVVFTDAQVEMLSEMEHQRWVEQRGADGWTSGPKDIDAKKSPYLGSWDSLSQEVKELDRQAVRGIPILLARAGYQIVT
jgi:rhodanese-related sulfurtransferase